MCFRLPFCPSGSPSVADLSTGTDRGFGIDHQWMTLGRRIFHRSKMALDFCCVIKDEIATWADGVRRNVDDKTVKPTSINHASVVYFCCCHVCGCCLNTGMCRTAPEALICDHQACHSLWFSMRSTLCVTLMCCERSCRRPTLTTFPSILIKQCADVVFILPSSSPSSTLPLSRRLVAWMKQANVTSARPTN